MSMRAAALSALAIAALLAASDLAPANDVTAPWPGSTPPPAPDDNPTTPARAELGRHLFFDSRLSGPGYMSCGTCHRPELAFSDGRRVAIGATGQSHPRNTPGLANIGYFTVLTWANPNETALETQSMAPLFGRDPVEMMADSRREEILRRFEGDASYRRLFLAAFPETDGKIDFPAIRLALAAFQRTLISADAPYDRFVRDEDPNAMNAKARRGMDLFLSDRLGCAACHVPPHFTDATSAPTFHNTGLYNLDGAGALPEGNQGLVTHSGNPADMGQFRTPSLRNIALTAPYMHDGTLETLDQVIDHYAAGGQAALTSTRSPLASPLVAGFDIDATERAELIAFLNALTDETFINDENLQTPFRYRPDSAD